MHYHVIPAPQLGSSLPTTQPVGEQTPPTHQEMHQKEFESRHELDSDDAASLARQIRARL